MLPGSSIVLASALILGGCHSNSHPDDQAAVYSAFTQNDLRNITVSQDRGSGTITLSGIVGSADRKTAAETLASKAAPGYTITNNIQVQNAGLSDLQKKAQQTAQLDSAIQDHFKQSLESRKDLKKEHITYEAANGTLYLKGSVRSEHQKKEAEDLARKDPQVKEVVNNLKVGPSKEKETATS